MSQYVVEYEHWEDDTESTRRLVGPFTNKQLAETWAHENRWAKGFDPRWSIRALRKPWSGAMQVDGSIRSRQVLP